MNVKDVRSMSIWKKEDPSKTTESEFRATGIEALDLTNRPINCLRRSGCKTIGDLLDLIDSEAGLKSVRNLGNKSENEILGKVEAFKRNFVGSKDFEASGKTVASTNRSGCVLMRPKGSTWYTKIEEYGIPQKTIDILHSCGVYYVADLYTKDFETEPSWKTVRSLFASIIAKSN